MGDWTSGLSWGIERLSFDPPPQPAIRCVSPVPSGPGPLSGGADSDQDTPRLDLELRMVGVYVSVGIRGAAYRF
jgi:hypothetical protein